MAETIPDPENETKRSKALHFQFKKVPYTQKLGIRLVEHTEDVVDLAMDYSEEVGTGFGTHHGGAIASLIDSAVAAAAWAGHDFARGDRGATVGLTVNYVGAAGGATLKARGRVTRRARELVFVTVAVTNSEGRAVADATGIYRIA